MVGIPIAKGRGIELTSSTNAGMAQWYELFMQVGAARYKFPDRKNPGQLYRYPALDFDYTLIVVGHHFNNGDRVSRERHSDVNSETVVAYYDDSGGGRGGDGDFNDLVVSVRKIAMPRFQTDEGFAHFAGLLQSTPGSKDQSPAKAL